MRRYEVESLTVCVSFREDHLCCSQNAKIKWQTIQDEDQNQIKGLKRHEQFAQKWHFFTQLHVTHEELFCHFFSYIISLSSSKMTTKKQHNITIMKVLIDSFVWETLWNWSHYSLKITVFMGKVAMFYLWMNHLIQNQSELLFMNLIWVLKLNPMTQNAWWKIFSK